MAGAGIRLFVAGETLTAATVNTYLQDQVVARFADAAARTAAFGGAGEPTLAEGMLSYLDSDNTVYVYDGSTFKAVGVASVIDAKGDLLVGTADDTVGRQAVGANGTVLMADSAQTNGIAWSEQSLGYRNVVINGAMQIAQRGTSTASITTSGYYTADRFNINLNSLGTWTQTVENDAPTGSGFRKSLKLLCTTADATPAAGDLFLFRQFIEGQNLQQFLKGTASAKQFTLSFWVKGTTTGTYTCELEDRDNTRAVSASYSIVAANTWEKKTITFPADTTGAFDNDNARSLDVVWALGAGTTYTSGTLQTTWSSITNANRFVGQTNVAAATNNYWQITGIQLEAGSVATPFEFEDIGTTIAKCQRYFQKSYNIDVAPGTNTSAGASYFTQGTDNAGNTMAVVRLITEMRAAPTVTSYKISGTSGSWQYDRSGVGTTDTATTSYYLSTNTINFYAGTGAAYVVAVFQGQWAASAEL